MSWWEPWIQRPSSIAPILQPGQGQGGRGEGATYNWRYAATRRPGVRPYFSCESAQGRIHRFPAHAGFARHRLGARADHRGRLWCQRRHRRLQRRLPHPQSIPALVCRGRLFAGLCALAGGHPGARGRRGHAGADRRGGHRAGLGAAAQLRAGRGGSADPRVGDGLRAGAVRHGGGAHQADVSLHRIHVDGGAGGRHPQHLEALRGAGTDAGAAEPERDRRRLVGRAVAGGGRHRAHPCAGRRRDAGRPAAAGGANPGAGAPGPAAAHRPRALGHCRGLAPSGRGARAAADGTGPAGGVGSPDLAAHQHPDRLACGGGCGVLADLCRPVDGVSDRAAGRGAGRGAAAPALGGAGAPGRCGLFRHAGLGPAPGAAAGAALRAGAAAVSAGPGDGALPPRRLPCRGRGDDGAGAARLWRGPARPGGHQGAGAGLLRTPGHAHAGQDRHWRAGRHPADEPGLRALAGPRRAGALDRSGGPGECRPAARRPVATRRLPAAGGLGRLSGARAAGQWGAGRAAGLGRHRHRLDRAADPRGPARRRRGRGAGGRGLALLRRARPGRAAPARSGAPGLTYTDTDGRTPSLRNADRTGLLRRAGGR
ncbi:hypothetical protein RA210_U40245 [Rubrivivax sp. A210]|nr:hypothetical protein RA210_U40245 [Rubrivivax sp. A210]